MIQFSLFFKINFHFFFLEFPQLDVGPPGMILKPLLSYILSRYVFCFPFWETSSTLSSHSSINFFLPSFLILRAFLFQNIFFISILLHEYILFSCLLLCFLLCSFSLNSFYILGLYFSSCLWAVSFILEAFCLVC